MKVCGFTVPRSKTRRSCGAGRRARRPIGRAIALGLVFACSLARESAAEGNLLLAGVESRRSGENYAYLGALIPLGARGRLGQGWVQRYWIDGYRYSYDVSNPALYGVDPQRIRARGKGLEAALGYHFTRDGIAVAGYAGLRYADTEFSPDDPGSRVRGTKVWPKLQFEIAAPLGSRWESRNIASYTFGLEGYWLRTRLVTTIGDGYEVGPEVIALGDRDFKALKVGVALGGLRPTPDSSLGLRGGYHFQSESNAVYVGLDLAVKF